MKKLLRTVALFAVISLGPASAYEVVAIRDGGTIQGVVQLQGNPPAPQRMTITKDSEVCGTGARLVGEVAVDGKGAVRGAVVYVEKIDSGKPWPIPPEGFFVDQKECRFMANSRVVRKGDAIRMKNTDAVFHNTHAYELVGNARLSMFNRGQPKGSEVEYDLQMRRGDVVKLECDVHNFMHEWLLALDHPYFAITGPDGAFTVDGVPAGTYTLIAWHPALGRQKIDVEAKGGSKVIADFVFKRQ